VELLFKLRNDLIDTSGRPIYVNERFRAETTKQGAGFARDLKVICWGPAVEEYLPFPQHYPNSRTANTSLLGAVNKQVQANVFRETLAPLQAIDLGRALQKKEWSL
jgi:hypothetical protein